MEVIGKRIHVSSMIMNGERTVMAKRLKNGVVGFLL
jgi:hypothetical protein